MQLFNSIHLFEVMFMSLAVIKRQKKNPRINQAVGQIQPSLEWLFEIVQHE